MLNIGGEVCLWECKDEIWGKRDMGEICSRDCDCAGSEDSGTELFCKRILYDQRDSICCPEGKCGLKTGVCVGNNEVAQSNEYKNCVCQDGTWHCRNTIVEDKNSRILFSKDMNTYKTTLKLNTYFDKLAHVKIMLFFDKKNYDGDINIIGLDDCEMNKNIAIEERNNIFEGDILSGEYTCELEISAPNLLEDQYFFYTGNALILSYTTLNLNTVCRDGVLEGSEECELNDLTTCKFLAPNTCTEPSCSPFCTCEFELVCDGSTCEKDSLDYIEHCAVCEDGRCDSNEDSLTCCEDCGSECGDGVCNCDETVTSCADDCLCNCEGTGYETYVIDGDTIYVDCKNDACWTPTPTNSNGGFLEFKWGAGGPLIASCIGKGPFYPACNYCDELEHGTYDDWVLPDSSTIEALCASDSHIQGHLSNTCFGEEVHKRYYWTSSSASGMHAKVAYFLTARCVAGFFLHKDVDNLDGLGIAVRCVRR